MHPSLTEDDECSLLFFPVSSVVDRETEEREKRTRQEAKERSERGVRLCHKQRRKKEKKPNRTRPIISKINKFRPWFIFQGLCCRCRCLFSLPLCCCALLGPLWPNSCPVYTGEHTSMWRLLAVFFCLVSFHVGWLEDASIVSSSLCLFISFLFLFCFCFYLWMKFFMALVFIAVMLLFFNDCPIDRLSKVFY